MKRLPILHPLPPPKRVYAEFTEEDSKRLVIGAKLRLDEGNIRPSDSMVEIVKKSLQKRPVTTRKALKFFSLKDDLKSSKYVQLRIDITRKTPIDQTFSDFKQLHGLYNNEERVLVEDVIRESREMSPENRSVFINQKMQPLVYFSHWATSRKWCFVREASDGINHNSYLASSFHLNSIKVSYNEQDFSLRGYECCSELPTSNFVMITPKTDTPLPVVQDYCFTGVDFVLMMLLLFSLQGRTFNSVEDDQPTKDSFDVNSFVLVDISDKNNLPLPSWTLAEFLDDVMPQFPPSSLYPDPPRSPPIPIPTQHLITSFFHGSSPSLPSPPVIDLEEEAPRMRSPEIFYCEEELYNSPPSLGPELSSPFAMAEELPQLFHFPTSEPVSYPSQTEFETEEQWMRQQLYDPWFADNLVLMEEGAAQQPLDTPQTELPPDPCDAGSSAFSAHLHLMGFSSPFPLSPVFFGSPEGIPVGGGAM